MPYRLSVSVHQTGAMMGNLTGWHIVLLIPAILALVLWFAAIWSIAKAELISGTERAVWILIVVVAPFLGAILWFAIGKQGTLSSGRGKP